MAGRLYFYCDIPPGQGGATPLAGDCRAFPRIPAEVKERFLRHGVRYVRKYGPDVDLLWQEVFQATDRREVDAHCATTGTRTVWSGNDRLRTIANRQAVARHPRTGEAVRFEVMVAEYGPDGLPRNVLYGDGEPNEDEVIALIRGVHEDARLGLPWRRSDVLIVDNVLTTHGRELFGEDRRVLVAMSDAQAGPAGAELAAATW